MSPALPLRQQHQVFSRFRAWSGDVPAGLFIDWLGEKIPSALVDAHLFNDPSRRSGQTPTHRPPGYQAPHDEEYFEWIDILEAAVDSTDVFTFLEFGAGYGRWSLRAACAARQLGRRYRLGLAEAAPEHVSEIRTVMALNEVDPADYAIFECAIAKEPGEGVFVVESPAGNPRVWYGQALTRNDMTGATITGEHEGFPLWRMSDGWGVIKIPQIPMSEVLNHYERVDLADLDLQGAEAGAVEEALALLTARVRRLHIGTHSHEIEGRLRELLTGAGWECVRDYPCAQENDTPFGRISFVDGVQTWTNPRR